VGQVRKFVLVDHSLRRLGGHHYPYACSVLEAAESAGFRPVLATHRDFRERSAVPAGWRLHPLFRRESYSRYTLDIQALGGDATGRAAGGKAGDPQAGTGQPGAGWWARWREANSRRARARHAAAFAADCARLFESEPVGDGDIVLFATTSELDLAGLAAWLATRAAPAAAGGGPDWHAQFHFGLYGGRDPGYARQRAGAAALRAVFEHALAQAQGHRLSFHCTTPQLAAQYDTLGVARFGVLPYPVHERFAPRELPAPTAPIRIACLGHSRREKGYVQLPELLRALWPAWLAAGRARLVLQTHRGRQRRAFDALLAQLGRTTPAAPGTLAIEYAGFPLPLDDYVQLLRGSDLGLLLYDATRYYARCSGVLLEMLCAGVPVLVPAGSWLAEQVEPVNQQWLDQCAASLGTTQTAGAAQWLDVPRATRSLLLAFAWDSPATPGRYLRVRATSAGREIATRVLGARPGGRPVRLSLDIPPDTTRVELALDAAWEPGAAPPARLQGWQASTSRLAAGRIGLTLAGEGGLASAVDELLAHHAHYQAGAREQAAAFRYQHAGARVIETLLAANMPASEPPPRHDPALP
jgi:hypothetical protein